MVPQLVCEVGRIAQQRIEVAHDGDDGTGLTVALVAVLDLEQLVHHLMDMAAVLRKKEFATCVVIVLFHKTYLAITPAACVAMTHTGV